MNNNEITTTAEMTADNTMYTKEEKNMNKSTEITVKFNEVNSSEKATKFSSQQSLKKVKFSGEGYYERPIARNIREFDVRKNIAAIKVSQGRKYLVIPVKISEFAFDQDWEGCKKGVRPAYIPGSLSWLWEKTTGLTDNKQLVRASEGNVMHRNSAGFRTALEDWRRKSILIVGNRGYTVTKSLGGVNNIPCYELDIENMLSESGVTAYVNEEMFAPIIDEKFKEEDGVFHPNEALTPEELGI